MKTEFKISKDSAFKPYICPLKDYTFKVNSVKGVIKVKIDGQNI